MLKMSKHNFGHQGSIYYETNVFLIQIVFELLEYTERQKDYDII